VGFEKFLETICGKSKAFLSLKRVDWHIQIVKFGSAILAGRGAEKQKQTKEKLYVSPVSPVILPSGVD
jgi:hypothetical protein